MAFNASQMPFDDSDFIAGFNLSDADADALVAAAPVTPDSIHPTNNELAADAREAASWSGFDAVDEFDCPDLLDHYDSNLTPTRSAPVVVADVNVADDDVDTLLFARTDLDVIDTTMTDDDKANFNRFAALGAEVNAALDAAAAAHHVRRGGKAAEVTPAAVATTTPGLSGRLAAAAAALEACAKNDMETEKGWGLQQAFRLDADTLDFMVGAWDTDVSFWERVHKAIGDRVAFNGSAAMIYQPETGMYLEDADFVSAIGPLVTAMARALIVLEVPERLRRDDAYQIALNAYNAAVASGAQAKIIDDKDKAKRAAYKVCAGGVEALWRRIEGFSPERRAKDAIAYLRTVRRIPEKRWLVNNRLVNFLDVTVDVHTGHVFDHSPNLYMRHVVNLNYRDVVDAKHPDVDAAFTRLDRDSQPGADTLVERFMGSMLTGSVRHKCFLYLHGPNNSGKSTIAKMAEWAVAPPEELGDGAALIVQAGADALMNLKGDQSKSNARHELRGRRGVWVDEAQSVNYHAGFMNEITNPVGKVTTQPLFAKSTDRVSWTPELSLILVGNSAAGIPMQEGTQARLLLVRSGDRMSNGDHDTSATAGAEVADVTILDRLQTQEARAAMMWRMICGARALGRDGDRGAMIGDCEWIYQARRDAEAERVDAFSVWLNSMVRVLDNPADAPTLDCYTLEEAAVEIRAVSKFYLLDDARFDHISDRKVNETLTSMGFTVSQRNTGRTIDGKKQRARVYPLAKKSRRDIPSYLADKCSIHPLRETHTQYAAMAMTQVDERLSRMDPDELMAYATRKVEEHRGSRTNSAAAVRH